MENKELIEAKMINSDILTDQEPTWCNASNNQFYESLKAEGLKYYAKEKAGLDTGCDLDMITSYLEAATSILEVGAGYGRVLDYILKNNFSAKVSAVERSQILFNFLKKKYKKEINLNYLDIQDNSKIKKRFDLILFLWSGISEFSSKEQPNLIHRLSKLLKKKGKLIIDSISPLNQPLEVEKIGIQSYCINLDNIKINTYVPTLSQIKTYANEAGLKSIEHITYNTNTGRKRVIYIFTNF